MKNQKVNRFYDSIADDYDRMISFKKRLDIEEPKFRNLVEKYSITSALDAGAGSGFHSVLLARCGVNVTAVDVSEKMLSKLRENAHIWDIPVKTLRSDFLKLHIPDTSFDAVFCLGNSLVHLTTNVNLKRAITNFAKHLRPGGTIIIQILNYDRILKHKNRIQSIKKSENNLFIRYYEFHKRNIFFNILNINTETLAHDLSTAVIKPVMSPDIKNILKKSGFKKIKCHSDLTLKPFSKLTSQDTVLTAIKAKTG